MTGGVATGAIPVSFFIVALIFLVYLASGVPRIWPCHDIAPSLRAEVA